MRKALICLCLAVLAAPAAASDPTEQNKAVVRRVVEEILGQGKFELADQLYAKDFVNHGQSRDYTLKEDQDGARGWRQAFPDMKMTVEKLVAEGDLVTVLWRARGTNTASGFGLPATGKPVELRGITIWRVVDGKIREEWSAYDQLSMMRQLGLFPANP
jgi:steroid delta-isomerase-like uncharacterized protein